MIENLKQKVEMEKKTKNSFVWKNTESAHHEN
jgi:hypothetical protein